MRNYRVVLPFLFFVTSVQLLFAQRTATYDVAAFTEITVKNNANLHLTQGDVQSVTVKAREETVGKLIVEVKDRKLIIRYPTNTWFDSKFDPGEVTVYVTTPQIDDVTVSGSGSIVAEEFLSARILDCYVSGSGFIKLLDVKAEKITTMLSGTGHIQLAGGSVVSELKMSLSGSGGVNASRLEAKNVSVVISGSGSCAVNALDNLKCKIAGSGNVTYDGNPAIETTIVGSGTVKERGL